MDDRREQFSEEDKRFQREIFGEESPEPGGASSSSSHERERETCRHQRASRTKREIRGVDQAEQGKRG
eukprot:9404881-Karenia_brevis.AAC.1